ncbi:ELYS protein, partial [Polypterus senegalus]
MPVHLFGVSCLNKEPFVLAGMSFHPLKLPSPRATPFPFLTRIPLCSHGASQPEKNGLAWLACGPQLEVVSSVTGERLSAYRFSGISENPPNVLTVKEFCWHKRTGLLVGLEEPEGSMLCLYDLGISRVVKAVVVPGRIVGIEPIINHGGASASTQHLHQSLRWFFGVAAVVTDVGHILLLDLCLDDLSCSQSELEASDLEVVNKSPAEIPRIRETVTREGRHLCLQLQSPSGTSATALQYISRTNQLAVGFSDGYLQLWNMKTLKKEYHSQLEGGRVPVYAFTFQEPENDPRNCCCLWAVQSSQDSREVALVVRICWRLLVRIPQTLEHFFGYLSKTLNCNCFVLGMTLTCIQACKRPSNLQ